MPTRGGHKDAGTQLLLGLSTPADIDIPNAQPDLVVPGDAGEADGQEDVEEEVPSDSSSDGFGTKKRPASASSVLKRPGSGQVFRRPSAKKGRRAVDPIQIELPSCICVC